MSGCSRRRFLQSGMAAGAVASFPALGATGKHSDWVTLGRSGIKVTRLAFGTGSSSGAVQRGLGQEGFTRLVRHAYDQGIRFFETAESYGQMHKMLGEALKGLPRDSYAFMSKVTTRSGDVNPAAKFDELRKLAQMDYFDIMLLHWQHTAEWREESKRWQDGIEEAQHKQVVRKRGASVHGLPALRQMPGFNWLDIGLIRTNHVGAHMDAEDYNTRGLGNVAEVLTHAQQMRKENLGMIGMKVVGQGEFTNREDRKAGVRFAFQKAGVAAVTIGFKTTAEIDEAIENVNLALA
jgi:aryl-alcohol dehydrogenase-like predicted oxidoreductase